MSYKYDRENGFRNADQIGADKEEFNQDVSNIVDTIKKLSSENVREAINVISCKEKQQQIDEQMKKQEIENRQDITMTTNSNLVSDIQKDIEGEIPEEQAIKNRESITMITNQNKEEDEREAI